MQGANPKLEKFSKFLKDHLRVLPDRGMFVSLWFFNLREMTKEENLERLKKGFGRRFTVRLEDRDYETIYVRLERDRLVEPVQGKLRLTEKGGELRILAEKPVATDIGTKRKFLDARKVNWFAEGL